MDKSTRSCGDASDGVRIINSEGKIGDSDMPISQSSRKREHAIPSALSLGFLSCLFFISPAVHFLYPSSKMVSLGCLSSASRTSFDVHCFGTFFIHPHSRNFCLYREGLMGRLVTEYV